MLRSTLKLLWLLKLETKEDTVFSESYLNECLFNLFFESDNQQLSASRNPDIQRKKGASMEYINSFNSVSKVSATLKISVQTGFKVKIFPFKVFVNSRPRCNKRFKCSFLFACLLCLLIKNLQIQLTNSPYKWPHNSKLMNRNKKSQH